MSTPDQTDRRLVDAVLGGDQDAFRLLVERDSAPVIAVCRRILGDPDEAEDVAQDAFIQAYSSLATFRGDGRFASWVTRIGARMAVARVAGRHEVVRDLSVVDDRVDGGSSDGDPEVGVLAGELHDVLLDAIGALPAGQRAIVAMRFYSDLSLEEIARATSTPIGTVKSRLHRGLAHLRDQLVSRPVL